MIPFPFGLESTILFPVSNEFMDEKLNNSNISRLTLGNVEEIFKMINNVDSLS